MTQEHPITPSPELIAKWASQAVKAANCSADVTVSVATQAARWGADQELEACCEWLSVPCPSYGRELRNARRPKPPSLKAQALDELHISFDRGYLKEGAADTIRRALEALPE
jgi:hypothetical protein